MSELNWELPLLFAGTAVLLVCSLAEKTGSGRVHISFKLSKRKVGELQTKRKKVSLLFATKLRKKARAQELPSEGESWNKTLPEYVEQLHKDWLKANKPKAELSSAQIEQARAWGTHCGRVT